MGGGAIGKKRNYQKIYIRDIKNYNETTQKMACVMLKFLDINSANSQLIGGSSSNVLFFNQTYNNF